MATFYTRIILDNEEKTEIVILNRKYKKEQITEELKGQNADGFVSELVSRGIYLSENKSMEMEANGSISYVPEGQAGTIYVDSFQKYDTLIIHPDGSHIQVEYDSPFKPVCDKVADKLDDVWFCLRRLWKK